MTLTKVKMERFTAFSNLELDFSPGINILIGANGTGKTHLMKACYAACDVAKTGDSFADKLVRVFLPSGRTAGRLVKRQRGRNAATLAIHRRNRTLKARIPSPQSNTAEVTGAARWADPALETAYIPVKEMLSNAPGFRSLYAARDIHFEEVYADILNRAYRPLLRGPMDVSRRKLIRLMRKGMPGSVIARREEFFLYSRQQGPIEFTLLAEGIRKLALLWLLIQNGTLPYGSVLFWDEPETNLNPALFGTVISVLLELQRQGVQIVLATHDYVILEELALQIEDSDQVLFHSLYHDADGEIACRSVANYLDIYPNAIAETFNRLYDRNVVRSLGGR